MPYRENAKPQVKTSWWARFLAWLEGSGGCRRSDMPMDDDPSCDCDVCVHGRDPQWWV